MQTRTEVAATPPNSYAPLAPPVPGEWVVKRSAARLVLGVGTRPLDDLGDVATP
jgi:hypothetical protein